MIFLNLIFYLKKVLLLKLEVKQKARELIEKQIKDQKLLLQKFEQAKTVEEKTQILEVIIYYPVV